MSHIESASVNYSTYDGFYRSRHQQHSNKSATLSSYSSDRRNKYNTLTPVEAKKLAKFMNVKPPVRTASVLHKPRPPPMVITNLDEINPAQSAQLFTNLSSSTSKVFQNQLGNLKKIFRYMPLRRSFMNNSNNTNSSKAHDKEHQHQTLSESVSQLCLNRSQSPTAFSPPPPPVELKSMTYMESNVNYSNYDEFTRARNKRSSTLLSNNIDDNLSLHQKQHLSTDVQPSKQFTLNNGDSDEPWQLMSLPVSFERNLTTVIEEKQNLNDTGRNVYSHSNSFNSNAIQQGKLMIKPPANFEDRKNVNSLDSYETNPKTSSSNSLTSITTADSVLDFYQAPVSPYRFSYAQQISFERASSRTSTGLPPKIPNSESNKSTPSYGTSSSSSIMNEINICDERDSVNAKRSSILNAEVATSNLDSEVDNTIVSDSSTLYGESSGNTAYVSKCAELEQQVNCLRNRLLSKDKELTDLQLKQWSADYLIDQLKATISRLEKENSQLKANLIINSRAKC